MTTVIPTKPKRNIGLLILAIFKLAKATLLILIGIGFLKLVHRDAEPAVRAFLSHFRGDPDSKYLHALLVKITSLSPKKLELIGVGSFIYAALFITEGIGLLRQKTWAEWLAIVSGAGFIPLELHEVLVQHSWKRILVLVINIAIVSYMVHELRKKSAKHI